jgi:hypothetical protein
MTDILALSNWVVLSTEHGDELIINAEYLVQPDCCLKCGGICCYAINYKQIPTFWHVRT